MTGGFYPPKTKKDKENLSKKQGESIHLTGGFHPPIGGIYPPYRGESIHLTGGIYPPNSVVALI